MRAWLLLLAVLATFQPIVQVASTEDTASTIFIRAITPREEYIYNTTDSSDDNAKTIRTDLSTTTATKTTTTKRTSTALGRAFNIEIDMSASTSSSSSSLSSPSSDAIESLKKLSYDSSDNEKTNRILSTATTTALSVATTQHKNKKQQHKRHHHHQQHQNAQHQEENSRTSTHQASSTTAAETRTTTTIPSAPIESIHHSDSSPPVSKLDASSTPISSSSSSSSPASSSPSPASNNIEDEPETYSNKEIINEKVKPDPEVLVEIENSLLSLFNMKRPPKIDRSKIIIPEAMKKLYEEIMNQQVVSVNLPKPGLLTKSANTVRSFTHQDSKIDHRFPHHHRFRLYFDVKSIPQKEKLKAAEIQLARDAISHAALDPIVANRTRYQVLAYDITRVGIRGKREPSYLLLDNKTIRLNSTDAISVDVQPAVERWLAHPEHNYGLLIEVRTSGSLKPAPHHHVRLRRSADELHDNWKHKQPLLFTYTDDGRHKARSIRDVSTRSKRADHQQHQHRRGRRRKTHDDCRRHSLYVDFSDVGWSDWIVAPPGYDAFYCLGKCPFGLFEHLNATNHAVVQTLVNNLNPAKVPKPCCVPTQLDGISMLYLNDQNTVVLKNYQDMTVVGCGCR